MDCYDVAFGVFDSNAYPPITPQRLTAALQTRGEIPEDIFARWMAQGLQAYTYFAVGDWTGRIKIGKSIDPWRRVTELIRSKNGEEASLVLVLRGEHLEKIYHNRFAHHLHGNEWFNPAPEVLAEIERLGSAPPLSSTHGGAQ